MSPRVSWAQLSVTPGPGALRPTRRLSSRRSESFDDPHAPGTDPLPPSAVAMSRRSGISSRRDGSPRGAVQSAPVVVAPLTDDRAHIRGGLFQLIFNTFGVVAVAALYMSYLTMRAFIVPIFWAVLVSVPVRYAKRQVVDVIAYIAKVRACCSWLHVRCDSYSRA